MHTNASSQNFSNCTEISLAPGPGGVSHASSVSQHRCSCCTTSYVSHLRFCLAQHSIYKFCNPKTTSILVHLNLLLPLIPLKYCQSPCATDPSVKECREKECSATITMHEL